MLVSGCRDQPPGGSNCGPASYPPGPGVSVPEVPGITSTGEAWLLARPGYPFPSGQEVAVSFKLTAAASDVARVRVEGVGFEPPGDVGEARRSETPEWQRAGREWTVTLRFPRSACFTVRVTVEGAVGSFTVRVK